MAIGAVQPGGLSVAARQTSAVYRLPAPYKGIDARAPFVAGVPDVSIYAYNLVPGDGGSVLRSGYREWQIGLDSGAGVSVNTAMPYVGVTGDGSEDRLFMVTNEGIWDATAASGTPTLKLAFSNTAVEAGYGVYTTFINDAGDKYMFYADSLNGLFRYDASSDTWAQAPGITGATATEVNFVAAHKDRIWLIERDSSDAWYLGLGAITGAATKFYFGGKLKNGGALRGLFSWSVDGGAGVDDQLVGVSGAGDVVVYQGADPGSDFTIQGSYYIGQLPKGPKFGSEQGGELYLLSTFGVIAMSDLLIGVSLTSASSDNTSARIAGQLRERMKTQSSLDGWAIRSIPSEGGLLISSPTIPGTQPIQYFFNLTVGGWGLWRGLDIVGFSAWNDAVVFGDSQLRVLYMDVEADNVLIDPPDPANNGDPIEFSILTSFSTFDAPSVFKRVKYIRPDVVSAEAPAYTATARYDYDLAEAVGAMSPSRDSVNLWDVGLWDTAIWGGDTSVGYNSVTGSFGVGRNVAIAYRGQTYRAMTLVGWDVVYDAGGPMF